MQRRHAVVVAGVDVGAGGDQYLERPRSEWWPPDAAASGPAGCARRALQVGLEDFSTCSRPHPCRVVDRLVVGAEHGRRGAVLCASRLAGNRPNKRNDQVTGSCSYGFSRKYDPARQGAGQVTRWRRAYQAMPIHSCSARMPPCMARWPVARNRKQRPAGRPTNTRSGPAAHRGHGCLKRSHRTWHVPGMVTSAIR